MPRRRPSRTPLDVLTYLAGVDQFWRDHIACRNADPTLFDPPEDNERYPLYPPRAVEAAKFCGECPVRAECLAEAIAMEDHGVRGGSWINRYGQAIPIVPLPRRRGRRAPAA